MRHALYAFLLSMLTTGATLAGPIELEGELIQGGIVFGTVPAGSTLELAGKPVAVDAEGNFVIGFDRDNPAEELLRLTLPSGEQLTEKIDIAAADYAIERVDGLPQSRVTPDPSVSERITREARQVGQARQRNDHNRTDWAQGFVWPARGRLSGHYGSQRILNGEPRRPHYGVDVAAPTGTPVTAPAPGVVVLAEPDLYFSGGTIIIDHGQQLSSSFLHLSEVSVAVGDRVEQGDEIGAIGATGRATGPHLDWRMNWRERRVNPGVLVAGQDPAPQ